MEREATTPMLRTIDADLERQSAQDNTDDPPNNPGSDIEEVDDSVIPLVEATGDWDSSTLELPLRRRRVGAPAASTSGDTNNRTIPYRTRASAGSEQESATTHSPKGKGKGKARQTDSEDSSSDDFKIRRRNVGHEGFFPGNNIDEKLLDDGLHLRQWKDYSVISGLNPFTLDEFNPNFNPQYNVLTPVLPPFADHHQEAGSWEEQDQEGDVVSRTEIHLGEDETLDSILQEMVEKEEKRVREAKGKGKAGGSKRKRNNGGGGGDKKRQKKDETR